MNQPRTPVPVSLPFLRSRVLIPALVFVAAILFGSSPADAQFPGSGQPLVPAQPLPLPQGGLQGGPLQGGQIQPPGQPAVSAGENVVGVQPALPGQPATAAPDVDPNHRGVVLGEPVEFLWKVGVFLKSSNKSCKNVKITIPVPTDWPEQSVEIDAEEIPPEVSNIDYRDGDSGLRQIVATMRNVAANTEVLMTVTFKVQIRSKSAPADTSYYVIPERVSRDLRAFLGTSPGISFRNVAMKRKAKELVESSDVAWQQVGAIYNWVRDNIRNENLEQTNSIEVFKNQEGSAEDITGLFVAMCRSQKIPARIVWVEGQQYAEFYLHDEQGNGHWFPCSVSGLNDFGGISDTRIVLQKGDDIRVPEKSESQRYVAEFLSCSGNARPGVRFIRELIFSR